MTFLLPLTSRFKGRQIGTDRFGNRYFESRAKRDSQGRLTRWVLYAGAAEASAVPAECRKIPGGVRGRRTTGPT